jgi:hypothetical protein
MTLRGHATQQCIIVTALKGAGLRPAPDHHDVGMLAAMLIAIFLIPVTFYVVDVSPIAAVNAPRRRLCALARIEWKR